MRTRSGTYVRRDSDSYNRKESAGMPDFRFSVFWLIREIQKYLHLDRVFKRGCRRAKISCHRG